MKEGMHQHACESHTKEDCSIVNELICHLPYAVFSAALALIVLSILTALGEWNTGTHKQHESSLDLLFHGFHFLHLVFATIGALLSYSRFSKQVVKGFIVATFSSLFFCTLSDIVLPYAAGSLFGVHMHLHLCLFSELHNVLPFLFVGLVTGVIMSQHNEATKAFHSVVSHFAHILVSSLAALFYMIGQGFYEWQSSMGLVFLLIIMVVVIPCTIADIVVPLFFARSRAK